jgi:hypothetical protein
VVASLVALIILLMPFHAFLTVWGSQLIGHYTALRLWKEVLLVISVFGVAYLLITDHKIRSHTLTRRLVQLIILYSLVQLIWGIVAYHHHDVSLKALGYGLIINLRFPAFFLVAWAVALRTGRLRDQWQQLVIWPAVIVVIFGLLQVFVLPRDWLAHFGYSSSTIYPYETINHNLHYIRIASTLRGANPLGAYLIIPISVLIGVLVRRGWSWRYGLLLIGSLATLYFSFSRSAWIGAVLSVATILALWLYSKRPQVLLGLMIAAIVIVVGASIGLWHNTRFQNVVFHTQSHSAVKTNSDSGHVAALRSGLHDVMHQPLGRGPGSAGPASIYNNHPARIAENYFIQIGQETGWLGLLLFLLINAGIGYLLWIRRSDPLALALFASLIGLSFVNLLSHAWADDTLAYVWWGLAGIAMAPIPQKAKTKKA